MARTNYSFERHQRDMAKKKKKEEKAKKKAERANSTRPEGSAENPVTDAGTGSETGAAPES